jgi:hypothetical protein
MMPILLTFMVGDMFDYQVDLCLEQLDFKVVSRDIKSVEGLDSKNSSLAQDLFETQRTHAQTTK